MKCDDCNEHKAVVVRLDSLEHEQKDLKIAVEKLKEIVTKMSSNERITIALISGGFSFAGAMLTKLF